MNDFMKKLIEKHPDKFTGDELVGVPVPEAVLEVMRKQEDELKELAAPLVKWLQENHGPYTEIRITWDRVAVQHDGIGLPFPYVGGE